MTPEDVELLFQSRKHLQSSNTNDDEDEESISDHERSFRVQQLQQVLAVAHNAWMSGSEDLDLFAEKLADGSREVSWRGPIGDSGLLDFFLSILPVEGLRQPLLIHALRLIGNSSADTDENRARVVESNQIPSIIRLFTDDSLLPFLLPVMYNLCVDYEPAQLAACDASLSSVLMEIVGGPRLQNCRPFLNIIYKILKMLITQEPEPTLANPATPIYLLDCAVSRTFPPDLEDFCGLTSVALAYLTNERFQTHLLNNGYCGLLMQCFEDACGHPHTGFDITTADPEEAAELKQIWTAFVQIFADISAGPYYFATLPLSSPTVRGLVRWLGAPTFSHPYLQTAACLSLGNIARSDEASTALLPDVISPVSNILNPTSTPTSQLLHAVLSFLKNLAIPAPNKPILGQYLLEPANGTVLSRLWSTETQPQTQFAAISLTRLLVSGSTANVARLCRPLSADPSSPAHERTDLHLLMSITSRADAEPTKFEGARTVAAVCKVFHTPSTSGLTPPPLGGWGDTDAATARERFYAAYSVDISKCLASLLIQRRFPALRSEVLFTMALMSRSPDGAAVVCRALYPTEVSGALMEAVTGRNMAAEEPSTSLTSSLSPEAGGSDSSSSWGSAGGQLDAITGLGLEPQQASLDPTQAASMGRIDRENGLVLVAELLKQDASVLPQFRRSVFEEMLKTGGEMVISERQRGDMG